MTVRDYLNLCRLSFALIPYPFSLREKGETQRGFKSLALRGFLETPSKWAIFLRFSETL